MAHRIVRLKNLYARGMMTPKEASHLCVGTEIGYVNVTIISSLMSANVSMM